MQPEPEKARSWLANGLLVVCSILLSLLLIELAYRAYLFGWDSFSIRKMNSARAIGAAGLLQASPYPEIVFELKPELNAYFKLVPFQTNSQGLRDKEYAVIKPDDAFRVAVIGDSYTMPAGVAIEDAYHSVLERELNEQSRDLNYEFINFAVGGYQLRQYWGVLQHRAQEYAPDLVLIGYCPRNDHIPDSLPKRPFQGKKITYPFFGSFAWEMIEMIRSAPQYSKTGHEIIIAEQQREYVREFFSAIGRFGKDRNIPIVVAFIDYIPRSPDAVKALAEESGLRFVDVTAAFQGTTPTDYVIYDLDSHPNAKAHRIFAERIGEYLKKKGLVPGPRPDPGPRPVRPTP